MQQSTEYQAIHGSEIDQQRPGWYVAKFTDDDGTMVAGPFDTEAQAEAEAQRRNRGTRDLGSYVADFLSGPPMQRSDIIAVCRRAGLNRAEIAVIVTEVEAGWNACDHWNGRAEGLHGVTA